jgi:hypothetical protein
MINNCLIDIYLSKIAHRKNLINLEESFFVHTEKSRINATPKAMFGSLDIREYRCGFFWPVIIYGGTLGSPFIFCPV